MSNLSPANETYQHGHPVSVVANHAKRTVDTSAAFFLPFLRPGMRLLDVGCGPGSITAGLAKRAEPAETIGIDLSPSVIETARSLAEAKAARHLTFEVGDILEPRFVPETFEAIFAHQVLQHLGQPVDALRQIRKLLAPGGVVGVRDVDWGSTTFYPENQGMRRFLTLYYELARRNRGEPNAGRHLRRWFRDAGFAEARVTTSTVSYTDPAATQEWGDTYAERTPLGALGAAIQTPSFASRTPKSWRGSNRKRDHNLSVLSGRRIACSRFLEPLIPVRFASSGS